MGYFTRAGMRAKTGVDKIAYDNDGSRKLFTKGSRVW
jgi:hypothetical protein